jgi:Domain of unknown function (DUF4180)
MKVHEIAGQKVFVCAETGPSLAEDHALGDLIGELFGSGARLVAIPLARLGSDFLRLSTGIAGHVLQKLVNYHFRIALLGDVAGAAVASEPLRDFVRESNRGTTVWFVEDLEALGAKLSGRPQE